MLIFSYRLLQIVFFPVILFIGLIRIFNKKENCRVYQENVISRFTFEPKSSGYNFGSDQSLKKLYDLSVNSNFENFINNIDNIILTTCLDEN